MEKFYADKARSTYTAYTNDDIEIHKLNYNPVNNFLCNKASFF